MPIDWSKPYDAKDNWPYIVQVAWTVYTKEGQFIKSENHFIKAKDFKISDASIRIHGITEQFLEVNGKEREWVMQLLYEDLLQYQPLVVGYFMELDYHMLGLGFYRAGLENPLKELPVFCVMKVTAQFVRYNEQRYLRLNELYQRLFKVQLENQHDALVDATATGQCFFELWKNGDIDEQIIAQQNLLKAPGKKNDLPKHLLILYGAGILVIFVLVYLIINWLYE